MAANIMAPSDRGASSSWRSTGQEDPQLIDYETELRDAIDGGRLVAPIEWEGFSGQAFGAFSAAAVLLAASKQTEKPRPLSMFARFHRPVPIGRPSALEIHMEREGRSVDTLAGRLADGNRSLATFTMAFGQPSVVPLESQSLRAMTPLREARPIYRLLEEIGVSAPRLMRRVGYRAEALEVPASPVGEEDWHIRNQWPGTSSPEPAVQAAVALMAIDAFVAPATIVANGFDINQPWPVAMPSVDLAAWFSALDSQAADADEESPAGWLSTRTRVPVTHAGFAVGHTQVWSGARLVAEGSSQVRLMPVPSGVGGSGGV